jgi:hypothetical protein
MIARRLMLLDYRAELLRCAEPTPEWLAYIKAERALSRRSTGACISVGAPWLLGWRSNLTQNSRSPRTGRRDLDRLLDDGQV